MSDQQPLWSEVDSYISTTLHLSDPILEHTLAANAAAGLPSIDVAPNQGKLLHLFARMQHARRILEIGTLGGYSTIWLARALPADGHLITLEFSQKHASVAQQNLTNAALDHLVEIRVGPAADSLRALQKEQAAPFDMIFIDADKPNNPVYLEWAIQLSHPGTLIVCDNVIREGEIADPNNIDPSVQGTRALFDLLAADSRLSATAIQTVGSKGYDGFALALVL